ncbi:glucosaminidase domain-containing protein [Enterococcus alcedinis]|nr:glucosaminidase domain-containing protein [Enterococcus alcedinis]MBP2102768.1 hypothetical protein [Enterococcus alcedinis]
MMKRIMKGIVTSSLLILSFSSIPVVFSDEFTTPPSLESIVESSTEETLMTSETLNESEFFSGEFESEGSSSVIETFDSTQFEESDDSSVATTETTISESLFEESVQGKLMLKTNEIISEKVIGKYATITSKDLILWEDLTLQKEKARSSQYYLQTLLVEKEFKLSDGKQYLSLKNNKNQLLGYISATELKIVDGQQGLFHSIDQFVSINGTYTIWQNFKWEQRHSATQFKNQTFRAKGIYYHFNGSRYLSLYNNKNQWIGYINENGVKKAIGDQGAFQSISRYVSIKGTYTIWQNFKWEKRYSASQFKNQTFKAKGIYNHFNGSHYLSLYNQKDQWVGYINEKGTDAARGQESIYHSYGKYISIIGNYDLWRNFSWSSNVHSSKYQGQTFLAKGIYYHFNGSRYLSVYDNKGNWLGYMNADGAKVVSDQQGTYQSYGKTVTVKTNNYAIWRNFSWSSKASGSHLGKKYLAKGVYQHYNGSRYLSLYDNNRWIGYINALGTTDTTSRWVKENNNWYYLNNRGQVTKGWAQIDNRWNYFDASGINIDDSQARFIGQSIDTARSIADKNQLYPSVMLAQAILESNYGTSELARKANNFFGMKFKENEDEGKYEKYFVETKEYDATTGETVTILAAFRKYPTLLKSFEDNALKLRQGVSWDHNYYSGTWRENAKTYKEATKALTGKYATDPLYNQSLDTRIEKWRLNQFD